jgi:hypothetical protein
MADSCRNGCLCILSIGENEMNNLSLILWFSDIIGNLGPLFLILGFVFAFGGIVSCAAYFIESASRWDQQRNKYVSYPEHPGLVWLFPPLFIVALMFLTVAALLPSKQTVLLIAGSEAIEDFASSPVGTELGQTSLDLINLIKSKIEEASPKPEE